MPGAADRSWPARFQLRVSIVLGTPVSYPVSGTLPLPHSLHGYCSYVRDSTVTSATAEQNGRDCGGDGGASVGGGGSSDGSAAAERHKSVHFATRRK